MQLFAAACGLEGIGAAQVGGALRSAAASFPQLDGAPLEQGASRSGRLVWAAVSHPQGMAAPRRYRAAGVDEVVLFDGFPVARDGAFPAHDAGELLGRWRDLPGRLEGIFSAVRLDLAGDALELLLDVYGMAQVFVHRRGSSFAVANSVAALRRLTGLRSPDPLGVASLLTLGWAAGGRTLLAGIERMPGGSLHRLSDRGGDSRSLAMPELVAPRRLRGRGPRLDELTERLVAATRAATGSGAPVTGGLTAGRDTRVVLALALAAGHPVDWFTSGRAGDVDVEIARHIAERLGLSHRVIQPEAPRGDEAWRLAMDRFSGQTDGLASAWDIADWVEHQAPFERVGLKLWGPGGEIARAGNIGLAIPFASNAPAIRRSVRVQEAVLHRKLGAWDGLVRRDALALARSHLDGFVARRIGEGWRSREVLDSYYAFERVAHWAAAGVRRAAASSDVFSPFVTHDFVRYSFSLSTGERYIEAAHRRLLSALAPTLRDMPFEKPWNPPRPRIGAVLAPARVAALAVRRLSGGGAEGAGHPHFGAAWYEAGLPVHSEACLSFPDSPLWDFVDRARLERLLRAGPRERSANAEGLCRALTAFWWLHGRRSG